MTKISSSNEICGTIFKGNTNSTLHILKDCNEKQSNQSKVVDNAKGHKQTTGITPALKKRSTSPSIFETSCKKKHSEAGLIYISL